MHTSDHIQGPSDQGTYMVETPPGPCEFQNKLRQLTLGCSRQTRTGRARAEVVPLLSKLMTNIVKVGDAIMRETERLGARVPSSLILPPFIRVPLIGSFSEHWYTEADPILQNASDQLAAMTLPFILHFVPFCHHI